MADLCGEHWGRAMSSNGRLLAAVLNCKTNLNVCRERAHAVSVIEYRGADISDGERSGPGVVALQVADLLGALHDLPMDLLPVLRVHVRADVRVQLLEEHAASRHARPHGNCAKIFFINIRFVDNLLCNKGYLFKSTY